MKNIITAKCSFILLLVLLAPFIVTVCPVEAATQYVTDTLYVGLREKKGEEYDVIKYLKTDTPLEVLEDDGDYYRVRTQEGEEGWILKRYVSAETPKPVVMTRLREEIDRLKSRIEEMRAEKRTQASKVNELDKLHKSARAEAASTAEELENMTVKYNALLEKSQDVVQLLEERDTLKAENERLSAVEDFLREENEDLRRTEMMWWFVAGGGVLFLGWIIGKASRQKRYY